MIATNLVSASLFGVFHQPGKRSPRGPAVFFITDHVQGSFGAGNRHVEKFVGMRGKLNHMIRHGIGDNRREDHHTAFAALKRVGRADGCSL